MNKQELIQRIEKIFRANTIEVDKVIGLYDQTKKVKEIESIPELKSDIIDLISSEFKIGAIKKEDIFIGNRKLGASYSIQVAIDIAKEWGYKYVMWNDDLIIGIDGISTGLYYNEI